MQNKKKIIVANWKMNKGYIEGLLLTNSVISTTPSHYDLKIVFCPPFIHLQTIAAMIKDYPLFSLGAQNCHEEKNGAYTGEISAEMLSSVGVQYVIVGHSERRNYCKESDDQLRKKLVLVVENKMIPIFCVGESLEDFQNNNTKLVLERQLEILKTLDIDNENPFFVAYEPVWSIGTGKNANIYEVNHAVQIIEKFIETQLSHWKVKILYGGSVNEKNANSFFEIERLDGLLVGGASLKSPEFTELLKNVSQI
jgi:triosephosphate isomerase